MNSIPSFFFRFVLLLGLGLGPLAGAAAEPKPVKEDCMDCHNDKTLSKTNAAHVAISLFVDLGRFTNSMHRGNTCRSCHADISSKHPSLRDNA